MVLLFFEFHCTKLCTNKKLLMASISPNVFLLFFCSCCRECSDSLKESIASVLRHTRKQSQAIYDRRTTNHKKQGAVSLATELVHASSSRAIETRKEGKGDSCSFDIGDFVALLEEGSTLKYPKIFIGQIQSFFEDNQASLLWYRNTRGSEYTFQFKPEPWLENIEALVPVTMKAIKKTPGIYNKLGS